MAKNGSVEVTTSDEFDELRAALDGLRDASYGPWLDVLCRWLARLRQKWYHLGMWRREALRWEGIARDYGERLEGLGDWDWIGAYRSARDAAWWESWDE